tara:strand:+ start:1601 stop:1936 length:336 start_codon:yes stop_codon:yes gene_type:complete
MEQAFQLNKAAFTHWLQSKGLSEPIGHGDDPDCCPIANFITDVFDQPSAWVALEQFGIGNQDKEPTPPWAQKFICHIKSYCGQRGEVYVDDCLKVLKENCSEIQHCCARAA